MFWQVTDEISLNERYLRIEYFQASIYCMNASSIQNLSRGFKHTPLG